MDSKKIGRQIFSLRTEKGMTQKELADKMHLSDRTVSKWERGVGLPDISLLRELSAILEVNIENLLSGDLNANDTIGGNMKNIKFYVCPSCKNELFSTGKGEVACCGRKLMPLNAQETDNEHDITVEKYDGESFVKIVHPMTKEKYISFAAFLTYDKVTFIKLYPEQDAHFYIPRGKGRLFFYCTEHGLFEKKI